MKGRPDTKDINRGEEGVGFVDSTGHKRLELMICLVVSLWVLRLYNSSKKKRGGFAGTEEFLHVWNRDLRSSCPGLESSVLTSRVK